MQVFSSYLEIFPLDAVESSKFHYLELLTYLQRAQLKKAFHVVVIFQEKLWENGKTFALSRCA